jgi:hypothetical protein
MWQANLTCMMQSSHLDTFETDAAQALIQYLISHFLNDWLSADAFLAGVTVVAFDFNKLCNGRQCHMYTYSLMLIFILVGRLLVLALSKACVV